ncbi:hypothetical protein FF011L_23300 [Roseimaritima multifibrata]|uniref:Uncharacterized protein n=1 Tax=Roseimaritima multifibrata TaxID=1930274 RepID=A0A517MF93_9BACT|nr:hypothetical protein [Roseimaritima multifibrata]QDS93560.1 hypothetical protein FF011L_23300 [Roseimaritima multifibrata]
MRHANVQQRLTPNDIGCLLTVFGIAASVPLAIVGRHFLQTATENTATNLIVGWTLLSIYAFFAILNFYLSAIRPWLHSRSGATDYKHVSGTPIVHTIFLALAIFALPPSLMAGILMLVLLALDTGAAHWAALAFAREFLPKRG